jgi:hypothetical protein
MSRPVGIGVRCACCAARAPWRFIDAVAVGGVTRRLRVLPHGWEYSKVTEGDVICVACVLGLIDKCLAAIAATVGHKTVSEV